MSSVSSLVLRVAPFLTACLLAAGPVAAQAPAAADGLPRLLSELLETPENPDGLRVACERIHAGADLVEFYRSRSFEPVWVTASGPRPAFALLVEALLDADRHGLRPAEYHTACLTEALRRFAQLEPGRLPAPIELAQQDIVLSDAFVTYGSHLLSGKVDPEALYPQWVSPKRKGEVFRVLREFAAHGDARRALQGLAPTRPEYLRLLETAAALQGVTNAGGWPRFDHERTLQLGMTDSVLPGLRRRLVLGGDLAATDASRGELFDAATDAAVRYFQWRHGLVADGVVGPATRAALNVPSQQRLDQVLLNLERWRWLPRDLGSRYILVNAAAFSLDAVEAGETVLHMRVIVGDRYTRTPVFSKDMTYLELNPFWNVPDSIVAEEFLPKLRSDPGYLSKNHYELLSGWGDDSRVLDPSAFDWRRVSAERFPGRVRQSPGPWNALGRIKFMFPNRFHVYLHDTPYRQLFSRRSRALSHGCIRVEHPVDLALFVLQDDPAWTGQALEAAIADGGRRVVQLPRPTKVHLLYWTAWVDGGGTVHFRDDIYSRDSVLLAAMGNTPRDDVAISADAVTAPQSPRVSN